jgi:hypothetical protein
MGVHRDLKYSVCTRQATPIPGAGILRARSRSRTTGNVICRDRRSSPLPPPLDPGQSRMSPARSILVQASATAIRCPHYRSLSSSRRISVQPLRAPLLRLPVPEHKSARHYQKAALQRTPSWRRRALPRRFVSGIAVTGLWGREPRYPDLQIESNSRSRGSSLQSTGLWLLLGSWLLAFGSSLMRRHLDTKGPLTNN